MSLILKPINRIPYILSSSFITMLKYLNKVKNNFLNFLVAQFYNRVSTGGAGAAPALVKKDLLRAAPTLHNTGFTFSPAITDLYLLVHQEVLLGRHH